MKLNLFLISLAVLLFFQTACNRDCHKNRTCAPVHYKFNLDSIKPYIWAERGSYWIYKDTKTGDLDTNICVDYALDTLYDKGTYEYSNNISIEYQRMYVTVWSTKYKWNLFWYTNSMNADQHDLDQEKKIKFTKELKGKSANCLFYNFDKNFIGGGPASPSHFVDEINSIEIQGTAYYNVKKFTMESDGTWGHTPGFTYAKVNYYWVKDIGIIKRESENNTGNWELIEYDIVRN
jgi:hypothetical protein